MEKVEKTRESWQERKMKIKHRWAVPFIFAEWLCERVSYLLEQWAFLDILGHAGRLAILVAVISYFMGADERRMQAEDQRKTKHYQAWQIINTARGQQSNGGRIDALQDLNRDRISLRGVDISDAYLQDIDLENADLGNSKLVGANLFRANLAGANLIDADLSRAFLLGADLSGVELRRANLSGASLGTANLSAAGLRTANLSEADLFQADLSEAVLFSANLRGANLTEADLDQAFLLLADLRNSNLSGIKNWQRIESIELANIYGAKNFPENFVEWAKEHGAVNIESEEEWGKLARYKRKKQREEHISEETRKR